MPAPLFKVSTLDSRLFTTTLPMRLIKMTGGLGNQMFIYALYLRMRRDFPHTRIDLSDMQHYHAHHGYEMHRVFALPQTEFCIPQWMKKVMEFVFFKTILERHQKGSLKAYRESHFWPLIYYKGFYQSERYFEDFKDEIRKAFTFNAELLSDKTRQLAQEMQQCTSISLHVRRGDYLLPQFFQNLGSVCTAEYYQRAADFMHEQFPDARFFVFSDDIAWVKEHVQLPNATYVDHNKGADSWQDMYLMSQCHHNIVANSSFSWWGAWLNPHADKLVCCPSIWTRAGGDENLCPASWHRITVE